MRSVTTEINGKRRQAGHYNQEGGARRPSRRRLEDRLRRLRNGDDVFLSLYVVDQYCLNYNAPVHCLVL